MIRLIRFMCAPRLYFGGNSPPPPTPAPLPSPPTYTDAAVQTENQQDSLRKRRGVASTILTSGSSASNTPGNASAALKALSGS